MASATKGALVVATSMASVEALKDQFGLCRWNYAIKSLNRYAKAAAMSSGQAGKRTVASATAAAAEANGNKACSCEDRMERRRAEKAEIVMHLVCWGPN